MSPSHFYRSKGGFSLIEVALTLFIIAVALLGMLALIPGALQLASVWMNPRRRDWPTKLGSTTAFRLRHFWREHPKQG